MYNKSRKYEDMLSKLDDLLNERSNDYNRINPWKKYSVTSIALIGLIIDLDFYSIALNSVDIVVVGTYAFGIRSLRVNVANVSDNDD